MMSSALDLSDHTALVIGGGGGGIGTAVVDVLAEAGADIGAVTFIEEDAADTAKRVAAAGRRVSIQMADVTDDAALIHAIAAVKEELGPIRYLVNVVGGNREEQVASMYEMERFDTSIARNLRYVVLSCREVARRLIQESLSGSIVNLSSSAAAGYPFMLAYAGAKAAVEATSRTMAVEWGRYGIRVNVVSPGGIDTPHSRQLARDVEPVPLKRQGTPRDLANVVLFLLSDLAAYVTGQVVRVDGGTGIVGRGGADSAAFLGAERQERLRLLREAERQA
jgi:NAD(P)-dependent dehydrogenase (short-subunit alcohol dehydrogenase family)